MDLFTELRLAELSSIKGVLGARSKEILELGGGNGLQAQELARWGHRMVSVDVGGRYIPGNTLRFPIIQYDGVRLPFRDQTFDCIFSSHVLEHVKELGSLLAETRRVLRRGGICAHILPTSSWRWWTLAAHYPFTVRYLFNRTTTHSGMRIPDSRTVVANRGWKYLLSRAVVAGPHGEFPNAFAELFYFRRAHWRSVLERSGFRVSHVIDCGIFYTGYGLMPRLSLQHRKSLAKVGGSSSAAFLSERTD